MRREDVPQPKGVLFVRDSQDVLAFGNNGSRGRDPSRAHSENEASGTALDRNLIDSFNESALMSGLRVVLPSFARGSRCANVTRYLAYGRTRS